MTAVLFKFSHPDGTPVVDAPFLVTTRKPSFDEMLNNGIQVSGDVNGTTDAQGEATLELMAGFATYYLIMNNPGAVPGDDGCTAGLRYRFMVTESTTVVRVEDLIITTPTWSRPWDETALQIIIDAKVTATDAADRAAASAAYAAEQVGILDGIEDRVTVMMNRAEVGADEAEAAEVNAEAARDSSEAFAVDALASVGLTQIDKMESKASELAAQAAAVEAAAIAAGIEGQLAADLFAPTGAGMLGTERAPMVSFNPGTVAAALGATLISVWEFQALITVKPTPADPTTWDWTPAIAGAQAKALELKSVSYGGFGVSFPAGIYPVTRIIHYSGVELKGMGSRSTFITALPFDPADGKPYGLLELAPGAIQGAHISGLNFCGSATAVYGGDAVNAAQWGFYCHAQYNEALTQGGFWHSNVTDVCFWSFNKGIWSRGGYTHANSKRPHQWIDWSGVQVVVQDGGEAWLFTGQHGQITVRGGHGEAISAATPKRALYSVKVAFDPDPATTAYDGINGESILDQPGVGNANRAGHNIVFCHGQSFQRARKGIWVNGPARNIAVDGCWSEGLGEAITLEQDCDVCLTNNRFANSGLGTTAGGAAGSGYILKQGANSGGAWGHGNSVEGSFDHLISPDSVGANDCDMFEFLGGLRTSTNGSVILPTRTQKSPLMDEFGVIDMGSHRFGTVAPNANHAVKLATITSNLLPGQIMVLRAATGAVTLQNSAGGNIVTCTGKDMTIPAGGIATLLRIQPYVAGSEFLVLSVSTHYASAAPSDGYYYAQGHIVEPSSSTATRWTCVTAGLAGAGAVFTASLVDSQVNFTPTLTFSTPGDLSITYSAQTGRATKIGRSVTVAIRLDLSSFTYTTGTGTLSITGLPFAPAVTSIGVVRFGGINKAGYSQLAFQIAGGATTATLVASGMGVAPADVVVADVPSGGAVTVRASITYDV